MPVGASERHDRPRDRDGDVGRRLLGERLSDVNTIAVAVDTLLVDNDDNSPDVKAYYQTALTDSNTAYSFWDLGIDKNIAQNYINAHKNIVWFTGARTQVRSLPYENKLKSFLDSGGRLFMSGMTCSTRPPARPPSCTTTCT